MKLTLISYGIAKEILPGHSHEIDVEVQTIEELKNQLFQKYPELQKLQSISFAVNEEYREDGFSLSENDEVVIIPPVAGG